MLVMARDHLTTPPANDFSAPVPERRPRSLTLVAVRQGSQWASLSPELGIASCGDTAEEALRSLQAAIVDVLEFARDSGFSAGEPVPAEELQALLDSHEGTDPVAYRRIDLDSTAEG
jgi:predicted RNase H-like HicB family nuclease